MTVAAPIPHYEEPSEIEIQQDFERKMQEKIETLESDVRSKDHQMLQERSVKREMMKVYGRRIQELNKDLADLIKTKAEKNNKITVMELTIVDQTRKIANLRNELSK